jgi:hypothetical protein
MGKSFEETESTAVGITCNVQRAVVGEQRGSWIDHQAPDREHEAALASIITSNASNEESFEESSDPGSNSADEGTGNESTPMSHENTIGSTVGSDMSPNMSPSPASHQWNVDSELVMKCMSDDVQMASKYVISIFDFGGQTVFNVSCRNST